MKLVQLIIAHRKYSKIRNAELLFINSYSKKCDKSHGDQYVANYEVGVTNVEYQILNNK